jgi:hypothetical protein
MNILPKDYRLSQETIDLWYHDYMMELALETSFGAPAMWKYDSPRNFRQYCVERIAHERIQRDLENALSSLKIV